MYVWHGQRQRDIIESVLSLHLYVSSKNQIQVITFLRKILLPAEPSWLPSYFLLLTKTISCLFYTYRFHLNVCLYAMPVQYPQRPEEGAKFTETGVRDSCEPSCGSWEPNPCLLKEEPFLQPPNFFWNTNHSPLLRSLQRYRILLLQQVSTLGWSSS